MKKLLAILFLVSVVTISCSDPGTTDIRVHGNEPALPEELKGLKIYSVSDGYGSHIKVAVFKGQVVGEQYRNGKYRYDAVNIYKQDGSVSKGYPESNILLENDSILILRK
jgi:hypothetical protein